MVAKITLPPLFPDMYCFTLFRRKTGVKVLKSETTRLWFKVFLLWVVVLFTGFSTEMKTVL